MTKAEMNRKPYVKATEGTITIRQAIEITGVSRTTLDKWIKKHNIKTYRQLNNQLLIGKESFEAALVEIRNRLADKDETEELNIVKKDNE